MSVVIQFPRALGAWVARGLDQGWPTATIILALVEQRMEPVVARAIVEALGEARKAGRAAPLDAVTIDGTMAQPFDEGAAASSRSGAWASLLTIHSVESNEH